MSEIRWIVILGVRFAGVAQLVEQRIRNAWVGGSIPFSGTICLSPHAKWLWRIVFLEIVGG